MHTSTTSNAARTTDADTIVVGVLAGQGAPADAPAQVAELLDSGEARTSFKALALTHADGKRWLVVGLGPQDELTAERARAAAAVACARAKETSARTLCWALPGDPGADAKERQALAAAVVEGT